MASGEMRARTCSEQFEILIDFMERNGDLHRLQPGPQGHLRAIGLWQELTTLLNSVGGGASRSTEKWKKVWADWKTKTKKKASLIRHQASRTGGGPHNSLRLTMVEERVIAIIGQQAVVGQNTAEVGFNMSSNQLPSAVVAQVESEAPDAHNGLNILNVTMATPLAPAPAPARVPPGHAPPDTVPLNQSTPIQTLSPSGHSGRSAHSRRTMRDRAATRVRRRITPFDRASSEFAAIEQRRLRFEEQREANLHLREMERLRVEMERLRLMEDHIAVMRRLADVTQAWLDHITSRDITAPLDLNSH